MNHPTANQPTALPTNKMTATMIAGAISVLLVYVLNQYAGMTLGTVEAQSITVLLAGFAGYMKKNRVIQAYQPTGN